MVVAGGAAAHLPGQRRLLLRAAGLQRPRHQGQVPRHRGQRHQGGAAHAQKQHSHGACYQQEFQGGRSPSELTLEQEVHQFLKELPPTKFFFLYFVGHNLDYNSLKMLAQKLTDIVGFINYSVCCRC